MPRSKFTTVRLSGIFSGKKVEFDFGTPKNGAKIAFQNSFSWGSR